MCTLALLLVAWSAGPSARPSSGAWSSAGFSIDASSIVAFGRPSTRAWPRDSFARSVAQTRGRTRAAPAPKTTPERPAAPPREQPVPFKPAETLTYDVGWSSLTAGTATVTVREKKPSYGSLAYYIVAEGRPTPLLARLYTLYYKADTLLDVYSLRPQRASLYSEEGKRRRTTTTTFQQSARKARYEVQTATLVKKDMSIPAETQDALSALYTLRSIPLKRGQRFDMPVCDHGNVYTVQMTVGDVESISTAMGPMDAIKVTPVITGAKGEAPSRGMAIWLSNDARRLPVRIEAQLLVGNFTLLLRQAVGV